MPLRPDNPIGLNLSRRPAAPVKLPRMTFPATGEPDLADPNAEQPFEQLVVPIPEVETDRPAPRPACAPAQPGATKPGAAQPAAAGQPGRVVIYGTVNCSACVAAVRDLMDRQVAFTYVDVSRDADGMQFLRAICGGEPMVPVVISIGFAGG